MRPIDADALKESLLKERDKISLEYVERYSFGCPSPSKHGEAMRGGIRKALRCMEETPTLDYAPVRHASWIRQDDTYTRFQCGECKSKNFDRCWVFCPLCGARMDGGKA